MNYLIKRISQYSIATLLSLVTLSAHAAPPPTAAGASEALPTVAAKTSGLERREGLLPVYLDRQRGKVWLEVPATSQPSGEVASYLYVEGIVTGLGSNPVGLDRGQLGNSHILTLRRVGGRVLLEEKNLRFRALTEDPEERRSVEQSFANSILWGGEIAAVDGDGKALVDLTSFLVRDAHEIVPTLKLTGQGRWDLDPARSAVDLTNCLSFPENLEFEAVLTYQSAEPGRLVAETAPLPGAMTIVQHQSLVKLPDDGYRPRRVDPRAGFFGVEFLNYSAPLSAPIETQWISRHRLEKVDPTAARSRVKKPIVYYLDPGCPEPVRSALLEGVGWWKDAFEKAGFLDAFRVEMLPKGVHPLDVRYNIIQWVHRATRGWSYGGGIIDPRTGEIVKGFVTLGSLRIRQDRMIFEGLVGTEETGKGGPNDPVAVSLARIRQLGAHEVGHSLGLEHNFAASTYGRASVMDYPGPLVGITPQGELDLSNAYAKGIGAWDYQVIRYGYTEFPPGANEAQELDAIVRDGLAHGLLFLTDQDARPASAAQPLGNLWDNGVDPVAALEQSLKVRQIALAHFGEHNLAAGQPLSYLQEVLVPVYFHHRYELDAAAKAVGGLLYVHAVRGDGEVASKPVPAEQQRRAIHTLTGLLAPQALDLPDSVIALLVPRPPSQRPNPEIFGGRTAPVFDPLEAAATAADLAVRALLQPERDGRL
ncbi:MAG TPA: zinc-dependent metalloprotease, partial [Thermoanaerobaculia bacterium]|nr:zinc-dependent metalloprotease [Thermoanaerobaculia bacterium]